MSIPSTSSGNDMKTIIEKFGGEDLLKSLSLYKFKQRLESLNLDFHESVMLRHERNKLKKR